MISKGTRVVVNPVSDALLAYYPGSEVTQTCEVFLLEDAPGEGTLDVLYAQILDGRHVAIYDFQIAHFGA